MELKRGNKEVMQKASQKLKYNVNPVILSEKNLVNLVKLKNAKQTHFPNLLNHAK